MSWVQPSAARQRPLLSEVLLVAGMFAVYNLGRVVAARNDGSAFGNADRVWATERRLHLPDEQVVQAWLLDRGDGLVQAANGYYAAVHFPLTFGVLAWLFWRRPVPYRWIRTTMLTATAAAMAVHLAFPLAPPRMMADLGFVDTGLTFGLSVYGPPDANSVANQFAAMPSLHVGWALLVAVAMISATRSRWRLLWAAHPVTTTLVVVVTANHYWLDALVGIALVGGALLVHRRRRSGPRWTARVAPCRHGRRPGEPAPDDVVVRFGALTRAAGPRRPRGHGRPWRPGLRPRLAGRVRERRSTRGLRRLVRRPAGGRPAGPVSRARASRTH